MHRCVFAGIETQGVIPNWAVIARCRQLSEHTFKTERFNGRLHNSAAHPSRPSPSSQPIPVHPNVHRLPSPVSDKQHPDRRRLSRPLPIRHRSATLPSRARAPARSPVTIARHQHASGHDCIPSVSVPRHSAPASESMYKPPRPLPPWPSDCCWSQFRQRHVAVAASLPRFPFK